jgi:hypothetical protein
MTIDDIPNFERLNDLAIAVYKIEETGKIIVPLYMTKRRDIDPINLLLIEEDSEKESEDSEKESEEEEEEEDFDSEIRYHFAWIKDLNRLLATSKKDGDNKHNTKVFCPYCCYGFCKDRNGERNLAEHRIYCRPNGPQRTKYLPEGDNFIEFNDVEKMQKLPFCIYSDFETINAEHVKVKSDVVFDANDNPLNSGMTIKTQHQVSGFTFYTVSPYFPPHKVTYRGPDAGEVFIHKIHEEKDRILEVIEDVVPMKLTPEEEGKYRRATTCHICNDEFSEDHVKGHKVRDHCHFTGEFRGAAHNICNLNLRTVKKIPVFFHNLGGYDSHIIFRNLNKKVDIEEPKVVAKNIEKFVSFSIGELYFKDSMQFLSSSLDKLTENLAAKAADGQRLKDVFPNLHDYYQDKWSHLPEKAFEMLTRKGVYPYSYMNDFERFEETSLPEKSMFYNDLKKKDISDKDFAFIHELWDTFQLKTLGDLHDLYMETDVLLLTDIFEEFRNFSLLKYRLDPAHFNTAPGLSWSAALLHTQQRLEIPTDPDMHLFFDAGLTGGASQVAEPYAKANHEGFSNFDTDVLRAYIAMFDANNQYGWAMSQYLPTHGFRWLEWDPRSTEYWTNFMLEQKDCQDTGYFFEVDLEYPEELHDTHDQYPLAPEHVEIKESMLSDYQKKLAKDLNMKVGGRKLCLTLQDKKHYICHYRNLKFYLEMGLKLTKVRRVLEFQQSAWIKPYIELNTSLRQQAKNKFEEGFAKLMNNSFFGKTCEDVRKYKDFKIVLNERRARKLISRPSLKKSKIYDENLATIQLQREVVTMNKPRYIGQAILDISKIVMYKFHYNFIMKNYPETTLLFTDTDSFCYLIPTESDLYSDIRGNTEWFDFSNYPEDHPNYDRSNHLIPGKFKDEMDGSFIEEFCGLRSKMYSILKAGGKEKKAANGILAQVKNDVITHEDYREVLINQKVRFHGGTKIHQEEHQLYTVDVAKKSLSPYNDKKWITYNDGEFTCYSYGHYKIDYKDMMECTE